MMSRILIADDHLVVRLGLSLLVRETLGEDCIIDQASDGIELCQLLNANVYDALMTDLNMQDVNPKDIVPTAIAIQPNIKVLVVSVNPVGVSSTGCLNAGAFGYIQKGTDDNEIKNAIHNVIVLGKKYITGIQIELLLKNDNHSTPFKRLSSRELEVVRFLLKGDGLLEISNKIDLAVSTVSTYKRRIFEKLNVKNVLELNRLSVGNDFE